MVPAIEPTDQELVEKVKGGDLAQYGELMHRYEKKLLFYAQKLVNNPDKAADVVQESFIKAYININQFNPRYPFANWIYRIVHNEAINYIKKYQREISLEDNDWISLTLRAKTDLEAEMADKEIRQSVRRSLDKLPLKYRSPLILFYLEGMSYREIAQILNIPQATVGTNISRGKKLLKSIHLEQTKLGTKRQNGKRTNDQND